MGRIIPYIRENKKCLKPPTSGTIDRELSLLKPFLVYTPLYIYIISECIYIYIERLMRILEHGIRLGTMW
jgi:hypothetical protein